MSNYAIIYSDSLSHHGIQGQKWGQRNGPPYPLDSKDHSAREKKAGWRKSLDKGTEPRKTKKNRSSNSNKKQAKSKSEKEFRRKVIKDNNNISNKSIKSMFNVDAEQAEKIRKFAIVAGLSLATAAGVYAVSYYVGKHPEVISNVTDKLKNLGKTANEAAASNLIDPSFNASGSDRAYSIGSEGLMNNELSGPNSRYFKDVEDPVGFFAERMGFKEMTGDELMHAGTGYFDQNDANEIIRGVTVNMRSVKTTTSLGAMDRRLSCWSGSNAYYMTRMTGNDYCSRNFQNLVDFNDFEKLYKEQPKIYDFKGNPASDFVGNFGQSERRFSSLDSNRLVNSLFNNTTLNENKPTIGFINAGYHSCTCNHQWNYELEKAVDGHVNLFMADSWSGERYNVASKMADGKIIYNDYGIMKFKDELGHYNANSLRFYTPELESINMDTMATTILGRPSIKHSEEDKFMGNYYAISYSSNSLQHHGIKGQRWGIRRFQNDDGSLTSAGRSRYDVGEARRAAVEGGLIGYANYRRTHQAPTTSDKERYKREKLKEKQRKKKARIAKATQRDYELSKKMGLVKNRKEYDDAMKKANEAKSRPKTKASTKPKDKMNAAEKALNVASLGTYGKIRKSEKKYKEYVDKNGHAPMNSAAGLALKGGLRYFSSQGTRLSVGLLKVVGATAASAVYSMAPTPTVKAGAMIVGRTVNAMGNLAIGMTDAYNIYSQGRDTVDYIKKKRGD